MSNRRRLCPACKKAGLNISTELIYYCVYCGFTADSRDKQAMLVVISAQVILPDKRVVFTSAEAWDYLVQTAKQYNYVTAEIIPRGMYKFVEALAYASYKDTRPDNMQGTDQWCTGLGTYRRRKLILPADVLAGLRSIADEFKITPFRYQARLLDGQATHAPAHVNHAPFYADVMPFASAVLEAIGLRYLSPVAPGIPVGQARQVTRTRVGSRSHYAY